MFGQNHKPKTVPVSVISLEFTKELLLSEIKYLRPSHAMADYEAGVAMGMSRVLYFLDLLTEEQHTHNADEIKEKVWGGGKRTKCL